jgi:drug/metabolite transporter (DMT)-like permease
MKMMNKTRIFPITQALLAALLFGASIPLSKILLNWANPLPLASFLYLGSGIGLFLFQIIKKLFKKQTSTEAGLNKADMPWLIGAILTGGVAAPILVLFSLKTTPASTASLVLNFETVATAMIALLFFKEAVGKRIWVSVICITLGSIIITWNFENHWGLSVGIIGIILACVCWGLDNNFTRNISSKNPFTIAIIKGISAGLISLLLAFLFKNPFPNIKIIFIAMLLGFFSYGFSIVLFVYAMRELGSARTSSLFGAAPFIGTILSFIIFKNVPNITFIISLPIMILGAVLLFRERHLHEHIHELKEHNHSHSHEDKHHNHVHIVEDIKADTIYHSHLHAHDKTRHSHLHTPDIHHRHTHKE